MQIDYKELLSNIRIPHDANIAIIGDDNKKFSEQINFCNSKDEFNSNLDFIESEKKYHVIITTDTKISENFINNVFVDSIDLGRIYLLNSKELFNHNLELINTFYYNYVELREYWIVKKTTKITPFIVVNPPFIEIIHQILNDLNKQISGHINYKFFKYSEKIVHDFYSTTAWYEELVSLFKTKEIFNKDAILMTPNISSIANFNTLINYKKISRDKYGEIKGIKSNRGMTGKILPFHVPEPYEAEHMYQICNKE